MIKKYQIFQINNTVSGTNNSSISIKLGVCSLLLAMLGLLSLPSPYTMAAPPQQQGIAVISEPTSNSIIGGIVPIIGSADHPAFQFYIVEFSPEPISGSQWQAIGGPGEQPVTNNQLALWDTTSVPDGSYTLRLRTVRQDGNYDEGFSTQVVVSNSQPTDTPTPEQPDETSTPAPQIVIPTETPTALPPTSTIIIEQPVVDTPTPRPSPTAAIVLEDPDDNNSLIPTVQGFSLAPLRDACLYGGLLMMSVFVFFAFLSALRLFFKDLRERQK